jgi:hypothetical protein
MNTGFQSLPSRILQKNMPIPSEIKQSEKEIEKRTNEIFLNILPPEVKESQIVLKVPIKPTKFPLKRNLFELNNSKNDESTKIEIKSLSQTPAPIEVDSIDAYKTLNMKRFLSPAPPTPKKQQTSKNNKVQKENLPFNNKLITHKDEFFKDIERPNFIDLTKVYNPSNLQCYNIIKQPAESKSCGAMALTMILTDCLRQYSIRNKDLSKQKNFFSDDYWNWCATCSLAKISTLFEVVKNKTKIEDLGFEIKTKFYHKDSSVLEYQKNEGNYPSETEFFLGSDNKAVLRDIQTILEKSRGVIVTITHPIVDGHYIVIDLIKDNKISFRDSYSGEAYCLSEEEFFLNWPEEEYCGVKCFYLSEIGNNNNQQK